MLLAASCAMAARIDEQARGGGEGGREGAGGGGRDAVLNKLVSRPTSY